MAYLRTIREKMRPVTEVSILSFIDRHRCVEGYLRRLLLIGLRLNAVQYRQAQRIIQSSRLFMPDIMKKSIDLISRNRFSFKEAKTKYPEFATATDLFMKFTSPYRNLLVHGIIDTIHELQLLQDLCQADRQFLLQFEKFLQAEFNKSAFDKPTTWGAQKGRQNEELPVVIKRLGLGKVFKGRPMSIVEARKRLEILR
jgi:hypothetical protein